MRTACLLLGAFVGSLLGGATADTFVHGHAQTVALDTVLLGAFPGAALASVFVWGLFGPQPARKARRKRLRL